VKNRRARDRVPNWRVENESDLGSANCQCFHGLVGAGHPHVKNHVRMLYVKAMQNRRDKALDRGLEGADIDHAGLDVLQRGDMTDDRAGSEVASANRSDSTMNALRSGLALGLAILLTRLIRVEHAFWVVLGVLPVLNASGSPAARKFWQEQAGTFIGFSVSAVVVAILGPHLTWYWSILPFVVFASTYAASTSGLLVGQAAFTLFAVVLFGIVLPQQKQTGRLRLEDIAIGGTISVAVGALIRRRGGASLGRLENPANT
jgi:uncharacterized membrane protein YccC